MEFALRTINNDRVRRSPETLALVAKPWVDYVASAVDALPY